MGVKDLLLGPEVGCGVAVAGQAPAHVKRARLPGHRHVADRPVALGATDALGDVNAVIEIDVVRQPINPRPADRNILSQALAIGCEHCGVCPDLGVAGHANGR